MGFEVPSPFKLEPTADEELFAKAWEVIEDEVMNMLELGWQQSLKGKGGNAVKYYQAANIYFYFIYLAQAARIKLDMLGMLETKCNSTAIDCQYGLSCIEGNLPCLSTYFDTNYRDAWDKIMNIFGVDRNIQECDDCCVGIGSMVIEGDDECNAFIIGPCSDIEINSPSEGAFGEFKLGEFKLKEVTNFNE